MYTFKMVVLGKERLYVAEDYDHYLDFLMVLKITEEMLHDKQIEPLVYNIFFPAVLSECARTLIKDEEKVKLIINFCKGLEADFFNSIHSDVAKMLGQKNDWILGAQKIRDEIRMNLLGKVGVDKLN